MDIGSEMLLIKQEPEEDETADVNRIELNHDPQNNIQAQVAPKPEPANDVTEETESSSGLHAEMAGEAEDCVNVKVKWMEELDDVLEAKHEDAAEDPLSGPVTIKEEPASDDAMEAVVSSSADVLQVKEEWLTDQTVEENKMAKTVPLATGNQALNEKPARNTANEADECYRAEEFGSDDVAGPSHVRMTSHSGTRTGSHTGRSLKNDISNQMESYSCGKCSYNCKGKDELRVHMRSHSKEKPYFCALCESRFSDCRQLKRHLRIHTGEKPYACDVCDSRFSDSGPLKRHKRTHTGERPYVCDVCDSTFREIGHLATHKRTHTGERPFVCNLCGSRFGRSNLLRIHMRTHTGEKPYKCESCDSRYTQASHLQSHLRTHTDEKPFSCDVCKATFRHAYDVTIHKRTHTGEKPYVCDVCGSGFSRLNSLKDHKRTHTGEKPFVCHFCESAFSLASTLRRHRRTHCKEEAVITQ